MPSDFPRSLSFPSLPGGRAQDEEGSKSTDLWAEGSFRLRVEDSRGGPAWEERVDRPFALIGRGSGAHVHIADRAVSARHVYLHLDARGLFAIDLATRSGTRFNGSDRPCGWLHVGESIEIAGRTFTLIDFRVRDLDSTNPAELELSRDGGEPFTALPSPSLADSRELSDDRSAGSSLVLSPATGRSGAIESQPNLLSDTSGQLARVTLYPTRGSGAPRSLGSQIVVVGRGASCGVRVEDSTIDRTHCLFVRGRSAGYLVDLTGRGTALNGEPFQGAARLNDGDSITLGETGFTVRVEAAAPSLVKPVEAPPVDPFGFAWPEDLPRELQGTVMAWMLRMFQAQHGETARRQEDFQNNLVAVIQQIHHDNALMISKHLEKMEAINRELSALRDEIRQRLDASPLAPIAAEPALPKPPPLNIKLDVPPSPTDPTSSTAWLLNRVQRLEEENRSTWRDLLSRLSGASKRTP